jgi:hypothetical protein
LLNGGAGHALDYDDVSDTLYGHPTVTLDPPLLAVAESRGLSGRELVEAYSVGFDVAVAIALALPVWPHFRSRLARHGLDRRHGGDLRLVPADEAVRRADAQRAGHRRIDGRQQPPELRHHDEAAASRAVELQRRAGRKARGIGLHRRSRSARKAARLLRGVRRRQRPFEAQESLDAPYAMLRDGVSFKKFPAATTRTARPTPRWRCRSAWAGPSATGSNRSR